ncbi:biotin/lipoyl-binding protein, partial [Klebsiella pneumoniae]
STQQADAQNGGPGGKGGRRTNRGATAPVSVSTVKKHSVPVYREGIGNVQALNAVTVRAQVDGRLLSVEFKEGQDVKKGDVLARIDPALYKAL